MRTITRLDVEQYRQRLLERVFTDNSLAVYLQALRLFFRHLEENLCIFESPLAGLAALRRAKPLQPVPTEAEMAILLGAPDVTTPLGVRDRALLETVYSTGVRRQELLDLATGAVDLDAGRVRVLGKGSRERMLPLGAEAARWLRNYLRDVRPVLAERGAGTALWLTKCGRTLDASALQQVLRRYRTAPGILTPIGLHSIRRACATHMLRHGASPVTIQMLLGHADLSHMAAYLRLAGADVKAMHAASRVGQ